MPRMCHSFYSSVLFVMFIEIVILIFNSCQFHNNLKFRKQQLQRDFLLIYLLSITLVPFLSENGFVRPEMPHPQT